MTSFTEWDGTTTLYYMSTAAKDATCATLEFTFTMPKDFVFLTYFQENPLISDYLTLSKNQRPRAARRGALLLLIRRHQ